MANHQICPDCGCSLDFGEKCDCQNEQKEKPTGETVSN